MQAQGGAPSRLANPRSAGAYLVVEALSAPHAVLVSVTMSRYWSTVF